MLLSEIDRNLVIVGTRVKSKITRNLGTVIKINKKVDNPHLKDDMISIQWDHGGFSGFLKFSDGTAILVKK